ncbi:MAG: cation transporter [Spirosomaceae bacterium]|nr:cation transporter [Spirosomataceae bacterium]
METLEQKNTKYSVTGMTCGSCVAKVKTALEKLPGVENAVVQLQYPQAVISTQNDIDLASFRRAVKAAGNYDISEKELVKELAPFPTISIKKKGVANSVAESLPEKSINTYKPLILIVSFIAGVSLLAQYPFTEFSGMLWMRHFMAGFFIVFAFFKLLNISGFASSYKMYDIVAARWSTWGYIYPFVELALGVMYLINFSPMLTNIATIIVLGVSSIGVIESNLNNRKIKCACLGDVFNLPMSTVTIVEDLTMVGMAILMLLV